MDSKKKRVLYNETQRQPDLTQSNGAVLSEIEKLKNHLLKPDKTNKDSLDQKKILHGLNELSKICKENIESVNSSNKLLEKKLHSMEISYKNAEQRLDLLATYCEKTQQMVERMESRHNEVKKSLDSLNEKLDQFEVEDDEDDEDDEDELMESD